MTRQFYELRESVARPLNRVFDLVNQLWVACVLLPLDFVYTWLITRPLRKLAWGFLPLVVASLFAMVVISGAWIPQGDLHGRYQRAANAAVAGEDAPAAELWLRKVAALDGRVTSETRYAQALAAAQAGDLDTTRALLQELAPVDGRGLVAAAPVAGAGSPGHVGPPVRGAGRGDPAASLGRAGAGAGQHTGPLTAGRAAGAAARIC